MFRKCCLEKFEIYAKNVQAKIRLDLSTHPLGPSPVILEVLKSAGIFDLWKYPESELMELKQQIARFTGLNEENIMLTSGAEQGIEIALIRLLNPGERITIKIPTFPLFNIFARNLCDAKVEFFSDIENIPEAKVIVLCSPNNPTTEEIPEEKIGSILEENPNSMILLDNVFCESGEERFENLVKEFNNLIILRSFSKDFGLAGIRLGFILSSEENIPALKNGICHFRISTLSQRIALEALKDRNHLEKMKLFLKHEFSFIKRELGSQIVRKSNTPFFLFDCRMDSQICREKMLEKDISIVDSSSFAGLERNFCRVTIGKREENEAFLAAVKEIQNLSK